MKPSWLTAVSLSDDDNSKGGAVFMICENDTGPYGYEIYSIDLKHLVKGYDTKPRQILPLSVKQLEKKKYPIYMGFFSLGSEIYMVEGMMFDQHTGSGQTHNRVYVYNTVTNTVTDGPPMLKAKRDPFVLGYFEGKVYLHGTNLHDHDFEVFDPKLQKWSQLPHAPVPSNEEGGYIECRPPPEYNIAASAVVGHKILLWTYRGEKFSFDILGNTWENTVQDVPFQLPFIGQAVPVDWFFLALVERDGPEFPLCALHVDPNVTFSHPIEQLTPLVHNIIAARQGYVAYLGDHYVCVVRSGYDGCPYSYTHCTRPNHYVTIDIFLVEPPCGDRSFFFAKDRYSLSYIVDGDVGDRICFATPIFRP